MSVRTVSEVMAEMQAFAPIELAESWDNVGLLVGDPAWPVERIMTCLTVTPESAAEAVRESVDLIVTHHPMPFHALKRLTPESLPGRLLLELIASRTAVYSPHTAFDSAPSGINQRLAEGLGLQAIRPLILANDAKTQAAVGAGRWGELAPAASLAEVAARLKQFLGVATLSVVGDFETSIQQVAVACGSGGSFLAAAIEQQCDLLVTGETTFHTCLEAQATGVALLLPGHFASERFALECLAEHLAGCFPDVQIWASREERDPIAQI